MILVKDNVEKIALDSRHIEKLKRAGYVAIDETEHPEKEAIPESIDEMTVSELRSLAKSKGIKAAGSLSKSDLLKTLREMQ